MVIATSAFGEYGNGSVAAAVLETNLLRSFPNITFNLMVGIGGGAPTPSHDIRLGDVVVGALNDSGGVWRYDRASLRSTETWRPADVLDRPPARLASAVARLRVEYEVNGCELDTAINDVFKKWPKLQKSHQRPDIASDRLYRSSIPHNDRELDCATACGDDSSSLVVRPERKSDSNYPDIHYGLIAAGYQVMKDAVLRDQLSMENGVLCFDMEAAGAFSGLNCIVVRGISDYADSHKTKEWQGYAAMTAAAYAKDLLSFVNSIKVDKTNSVSESFQG